MKAFIRVLCLGLIVALFPTGSFGALTRNRQNLLGKFYVSNVKGAVTCIVDGRITELKKGATILARGTIVDTPQDSSATLVFSNGTGVYVDGNTRFTVKIFEQEFFAPNNNLRVEPSNSNTLVLLDRGRVVISTPRLLSGTTMVYETNLAAVNIRGEKVMIETNDKQTHVAMITGVASVNPRGPDGNFVSIGRRVQTGNEAFVKFTLGGTSEDAAQVVKSEEGHAAGGIAMGTAASNGVAPVPHRPTTVSTAAITQDTEATVLRLSGLARTRLPGGTEDVQLAEGSRLPKGATIYTEEAAELYLQPFPGAIAAIRPKSTVQIEKLSVVTDDGVVKKQSAILNLTAGSIVSTIDPAKRDINDYGIRTPKGLAAARGTSFTVSVEDDGFSVATTADTVSFTLPSGESYAIQAGNITITPAGGEPQAPVSIGQAIAANPALAGVIQTAVTTVANVVQNNIGNLPADSATNILTKVLTVATAALPGQATALAAQAVTAVTAPGSSTAGESAVAAAAVTAAIVTAAPTQASQIAAAGVAASPAQMNTIAAAAAHAAPDQAEHVATAVVATLTSGNTVTASTVEAATQLASAISASVPAKAAPVAAAIMNALAQTNPQATPQSNAQMASVIAAGVTAAAPDQAVPVAATMMKLLSQASPNATTQTLAQSGATLASAITSVVPEKAQPVSTAVMQLLVESNPNATPGDSVAAAGLIAAAVSAVAPDQSAAITQGVATAANQPLASVQISATASAAEATQIAQAASSAASTGSQASATGNQSAAAAAQASQNSQSYAQSDGGNSGNSGSSGGNGNSGGNSSSGGNGNGNSGNASGNGGSVASSGGSGSGGNSGGSGSSGAGTDGNTSTSITVTNFDPSALNQLTPDLQAAQNAQSGVQFTPDPSGGTVNPPTPTIPPTNPIDYVTSASSG